MVLNGGTKGGGGQYDTRALWAPPHLCQTTTLSHTESLVDLPATQISDLTLTGLGRGSNQTSTSKSPEFANLVSRVKGPFSLPGSPRAASPKNVV